MFKLIFGLLRLLFWTLVLALIFHNFAARKALTLGLGYVLGVGVEAESARVDFLGSQVMYRNVKLLNPEGFGSEPMVKMPYLTLALDSGALFDGRILFKKIDADLSDFLILRNADGRVNWFNLRAVQAWQKGADPQHAAGVDHFVLTMRRATYRDLSVSPPQEKAVLTEVESKDYGPVSSLEQMLKISSREALKALGLERFGSGILD